MDFKAICRKCSSSVVLRHLAVSDTSQKCPQCGEPFEFELYREPVRSQFEKEVVDNLSRILTAVSKDGRAAAPEYTSLKIMAIVYRVAGVLALLGCLIGAVAAGKPGDRLVMLISGPILCLCCFAAAAILDAIRDIARNSFK